AARAAAVAGDGLVDNHLAALDRDLAEAAWLTAERRAALRDEGRRAIIGAHIRAALERDPERTRRALADGEAAALLHPTDKAAWLAEADEAVRAGRVAARAELPARRAAELEALRTGAPPAVPLTEADFAA